MFFKRVFVLAMVAGMTMVALSSCKKDANPVKGSAHQVTRKWETGPDSSGGQDPPVPPKH